MPTPGSETYKSTSPLETRTKSTYSSRKPVEAIGGPEVAEPTITGLNPDTMPVPSPDFLVEVLGTGFNPASVIVWNHQDVETEYLDEGKLQTLIQTTAVSVDPVAVRNGEKLSNEVNFTFTKSAPPE
jgi:hypothetical protein